MTHFKDYLRDLHKEDKIEQDFNHRATEKVDQTTNNPLNNQLYLQ